MSSKQSCASPAIPVPRPASRANGSVPIAIISRKPKKNGERTLARPDRQQDFFAERIFELFELQSRLTLVAEYFQYGWPIFFGNLDAAVFEVHDVHLQRFDLKIPVVAAVGTSQRHLGLLRFSILWDGWRHTQCNNGRILVDFRSHAHRVVPNP